MMNRGNSTGAYPRVLLLASLVLLIGGVFIFLGEYHYTRAKFFEKSGEYQKALSAYRLVVTYNPFNPRYHEDFGVLYYGGGEWELTLQEAQKALALSPYNSVAHQLLGRAYQKLGDRDLAEQEFYLAVQHNPVLNPDMQRDLAMVYFQQQRYGDVILLAQNVIALYPLSIFQSAIAVGVRAYEERIRQELSDLANVMGVSYIQKEKYELAEQSFKLALQYRPDNKVAEQNLGKVRKEQLEQ